MRPVTFQLKFWSLMSFSTDSCCGVKVLGSTCPMDPFSTVSCGHRHKTHTSTPQQEKAQGRRKRTRGGDETSKEGTSESVRSMSRAISQNETKRRTHDKRAALAPCVFTTIKQVDNVLTNSSYPKNRGRGHKNGLKTRPGEIQKKSTQHSRSR